MELLKQINKTKFLIPYEQIYIQSHHHHKHLIPEQYSGEYNPMYQVVPQPATSQKLQCTQLTPKTVSVVPPGDGRLMPETCRGSRHNKVIVKVKVY
jgi:hypothetical protein